MTTPRTTSRRHILRMAGVTAAGASVAACAGNKRDSEVLSSTTSPDTSRSLKLPYLFDGDPQAQQSARRLLSAAASVENLHRHEEFMRLAIEVSDGNPTYPFGAVVVDHETGDVLAQGVNRNAENPVLHGEIVAINDYVTRHGNARWDRTTLYSTGEPCGMCCGALAWARIPRVVWASSRATLRRLDLPGIHISAIEAAARAYALYQPELFLGGVLAEEMDKRFATRVR
ncbi:MAG: nucleoside deaminase [Mycobacterium sp.]|nr:nucleoside deaminase [Mycobacterium sp.]